MFSSLATSRTASGRSLSISLILTLSGVLLIALLFVGCGGGDKAPAGIQDDSAVIATVGSENITSDYYEDRLAQLAGNELPVEDGQYMDTSTEAGKRAFLKILINKELLTQKAVQLGYDKEPGIQTARKSITEYEGGLAMWADVVGDISRKVTEEELQAFYAQMGTEYVCNYVICNFEDDAMEAREFALTGADWEDVVDKFHDGSPATTGKYEISVPFGQYSSEFEDLVFAEELGGVSMPISTSYGFWIVRVIKINHKDKPSLEESKGRILDITQNRKSGRLRSDFKKEIRAKYEFQIDEVALWATYQGVPEGGLMDPVTNKPYTRDQLKPLDVRSEHLGDILYSYKGRDGNLIEYTVADYKNTFDSMGVFQRPKRSDMLGGFRQKLTDEVERGLMNLEAENRGYFEKPEVVAKVDLKVEEAMVTRLYKEVVTFDDKISPEELEAFWADHKTDYHVEESRSGHLVVCLNRQKADAARKAIMDGKTWAEVLVKFGSDATNKSKGGKTDKIFAVSKSPIVEPLFNLEVGGISQPFPVGSDRFAVVQLENIIAAHDYEMHEVSEAIGGRIRKVRQEDAFVALLDQWGEEFGVVINSENLAGLKSWDVLTAPDDTLVPIN